MLTSDQLTELLHRASLSRSDKALIVLAFDSVTPRTVAEIKSVAKSHGLREIQNWNVSQILKSTKGLAVSGDDGWSLSVRGKSYLESAGLLPSPSTPIRNVLADLRKHATAISNPDTKAFVEEAVGCLEAGFFRAGIVLSWIGAVATLYEFVVQQHLAAFNAEARKTNPKWKDAKNIDDLARMGESDFLDVLDRLSLLPKSVKQSLKAALNLRNGCGHPNSLQVGLHQAAAHVETLVLHVFSKFR